MQMEVPLPSLGDDDDAVHGGRVSAWLAHEGDALESGDDLIEITTDKAAFVVAAPFDGVLLEKCVREDQNITVGAVLCLFEVGNA